MPQARVLLGTEVVVDFMNERQPFYQQTRMLMVAGRVGEFDLWVTAPQVVDLVYLLSEGGKPELLPRAMERVRGLRTFVQVADLTAANVDRMLASSGQNPEGQLMVNAAIDLRADFLLAHDPGRPGKRPGQGHERAGHVRMAVREPRPGLHANRDLAKPSRCHLPVT